VSKVKSTATPIPRISLTPVEAAVSTGLSRTRIFKAIRDNKLLARGEGKATIIEIEELAKYVRSLPPKGRAGSNLQIQDDQQVSRPTVTANSYDVELLGYGENEDGPGFAEGACSPPAKSKLAKACERTCRGRPTPAPSQIRSTAMSEGEGQSGSDAVVRVHGKTEARVKRGDEPVTDGCLTRNSAASKPPKGGKS
jgi:hypothetical protein